jgi:hypothetical protein
MLPAFELFVENFPCVVAVAAADGHDLRAPLELMDVELEELNKKLVQEQ